MRHLDLFSGIGGFALAAEWAGWETVGFCEVDEWCQRVLAKNFPGVPIHDDVRTYAGQECEIITAGFPCQPYSVAGQRRGHSDDRALGHEFVRLVGECRPRWAIGENVYGLITLGLDDLLSDLENLAYRVEVFSIPACAVYAPHRRDRIWIIANEDSATIRTEQKPDTRCTGTPEPRTTREPGTTAHADEESEPTLANNETVARELVSNAERERGRGGNSERQHAKDVGELGRGSRGNRRGMEQWSIEPGLGRVANGVPERLDRLRGLGNAIVPQVAYEIFRGINATEVEL